MSLSNKVPLVLRQAVRFTPSLHIQIRDHVQARGLDRFIAPEPSNLRDPGKMVLPAPMLSGIIPKCVRSGGQRRP